MQPSQVVNEGMGHIFVDTNILLDITTKDSPFQDWSTNALVEAQAVATLAGNAIIYAELCAGYITKQEVDAFVSVLKIEWLEIPLEAAFAASCAFKTYKGRGGSRTGVLPDFLIGAHAEALTVPLLTRDVRRYRTYFPDLQLIAPPQ